MLSFDDARKMILERIISLPCRELPLLDALNLIAYEDVAAAWKLPTFDNSAMDGYAVRCNEFSPLGKMAVSGAVMAGESGKSIYPAGTAVRIMTGAPIPSGFDAVIPFEEIEEDDGDSIKLPARLEKGQHIRFSGEDVRAGDPVVRRGGVIRAADISMLAATGVESIKVFRRARVGILSTGDELVEPGGDVSGGGIINSNSPALAAAVLDAGGEPVMLGIARDNLESLRERVSAGLECDMLVTSAGVSAGERDLVRDVLAEAGVESVFWKVAVKPGGPTAFGVKGNLPVFSLPGNPVSSLLTFEAFVRPAILRMSGHENCFRISLNGVLDQDVRRKADGKTHLMRVRVSFDNGIYRVASSGTQQTGLQKTLVDANAIAVLPPDRTKYEKGDKVRFQFLNDLAMLQSL